MHDKALSRVMDTGLDSWTARQWGDGKIPEWTSLSRAQSKAITYDTANGVMSSAPPAGNAEARRLSMADPQLSPARLSLAHSPRRPLCRQCSPPDSQASIDRCHLIVHGAVLRRGYALAGERLIVHILGTPPGLRALSSFISPRRCAAYCTFLYAQVPLKRPSAKNHERPSHCDTFDCRETNGICRSQEQQTSLSQQGKNGL